MVGDSDWWHFLRMTIHWLTTHNPSLWNYGYLLIHLDRVWSCFSQKAAWRRHQGGHWVKGHAYKYFGNIMYTLHFNAAFCCFCEQTVHCVWHFQTSLMTLNLKIAVKELDLIRGVQPASIILKRLSSYARLLPSQCHWSTEAGAWKTWYGSDLWTAYRRVYVRVCVRVCVRACICLCTRDKWGYA